MSKTTKLQGISDIEALKLVFEGADVYRMDLAGKYRELQKRGLVRIVKAKNAPKSGIEQQPYFGCIITAKGVRMLAEAFVKGKH